MLKITTMTLPLHDALYSFDRDDDGGHCHGFTIYLPNQKIVNVNLKGRNGYTFLHMALNSVNYLSLEIFQHLIETISQNWENSC